MAWGNDSGWMKGTKYLWFEKKKLSWIVVYLTAIKLLMLTAPLKTQSVSFDQQLHSIMHRTRHSTDHTFCFCSPLKFAKSDMCINLLRSSTRLHWKTRLPNHNHTYHFYIWLSASAASLSFLLSSEFNRKFSFPHVHVQLMGCENWTAKLLMSQTSASTCPPPFFYLGYIFKFLMMLFCLIVYCFKAFNSRILRIDPGSRVFSLLKKKLNQTNNSHICLTACLH